MSLRRKIAEMAPNEMAMMGAAFGPIGAGVGGAYGADRGDQLRGGLSAGLGSLGGGVLAGMTIAPLLAAGGSLLGGGLGKLLSDDSDAGYYGATLGSGLGSLTGILAGSMLGARAGYDILGPGDNYDPGPQGPPKLSSYRPTGLDIVKLAYSELAQMSVAQLPYMAPNPVRQQQVERGLPLPLVAALGAGLTGMHLAGDAPTMGNKLRRTVNQTLGTDLDTESRAAAILSALR